MTYTAATDTNLLTELALAEAAYTAAAAAYDAPGVPYKGVEADAFAAAEAACDALRSRVYGD